MVGEDVLDDGDLEVETDQDVEDEENEMNVSD